MTVIHIEAVCLCFFLLLLFGNLTLICKARLLGEKAPMLLGIAPMIVQSDSMYPEICSGDLVFIKKAGIDEITEGDVVSFYDPMWDGSGIVTHRVETVITAEGVRTLQTKGDANDSADLLPVTEDRLIGVLAFRLKGLVRIALLFQSTSAIIVVTAVSLSLVLWAVFAHGHSRKPRGTAQIKRGRTQHDKKETV